MKIVTIESEAYKSLARKIDRIADYIRESGQNAPAPEPDPSEVWVGNDEAAELLQISKRTLQRLRSNGEITYSIKGGKVQYTLAEVRRLLPGRVIKSKLDAEQELLRSHREAHARRGGKAKGGGR